MCIRDPALTKLPTLSKAAWYLLVCSTIFLKSNNFFCAAICESSRNAHRRDVLKLSF